MTDMILYMTHTCPYSRRVIETLETLGLKAELRNIQEEGNARELTERGGKEQVPYLVDESRGVEMYESEDIVEYLKNAYEK